MFSFRMCMFYSFCAVQGSKREQSALLFLAEELEHHGYLAVHVQVLELCVVGNLGLDLSDLLRQTLALLGLRSHLFANFFDLLMNFAPGSLRLVGLGLMLGHDFFRL